MDKHKVPDTLQVNITRDLMGHVRQNSTVTGNSTLLDYYAASSDDDDANDEADNSLEIHSSIENEMGKFNEFKKIISDNLITPSSIKSGSNSNNSSSNILTNNNTSKINTNNIHNNGAMNDNTYDKYGFKKTNSFISDKDFNDWFKDYNPYTIRRKQKWIKFLKKNGLFINENNSVPLKYPPKSDELFKFIKKGLPSEWRGKAWFHFVKGPEKIKENIGLYNALAFETFNLKNENTDAIEKDLNRTFPDNIYFQNNTPMINSLRRVLKCFSIYKPKIGYCQSLNFITALLLIFLDEEETFWMLVIITDNFLPNVHESSLEGVTINQGMLLLFLKQHLPNIWKIIINNDNDNLINDIDLNDSSYLYFLPSLTFCTTNWFMSLFIGVLPIETTLRVWDIIFYQGPISIFQISLGIFKMLEPDLTKSYCQIHGLNNNKVINSISQLNLHSDTDLTNLSNRKSNYSLNNNNNNSNSNFSNEEFNNNNEILSGLLFQKIQNTPKRILNVNLFIEEIFRFDSCSFAKLNPNEMKRCKDFVVQSRETHASIAKRHENLGMSRQERRKLIEQHMTMSFSDNNLNDNINNRNSNNGNIFNSSMLHANSINNDTQNIEKHRIRGNGLKTAYWNVGLNRRIKKIYSKGNPS